MCCSTIIIIVELQKLKLKIVSLTSSFLNFLDLPKFPKNSTQNEQNDGNEIVYKMNKSKRGYCLIIHMTKGREGDEKDVDELTKFFKKIDFAVKEYTDFTNKKIEMLMKNVTNKTDDVRQSCCFVMFILAHGSTDKDGYSYFRTKDATYKVSDIRSKIEDARLLVGKPKLLFIQTCRGGTVDTGHSQCDNDLDPNTDKIPRGSDFLLSFATIKEFIAIRHEQKGTVFIQNLCQVFSTYYKECDVATMMTIVTNRVAALTENVKKDGEIVPKAKQNPETTITFRKFLYFGTPPHAPANDLTKLNECKQ